MNKIKHIFRVGWKIFFIVNFSLSLLVVYPLFYLFFLSDKTLPNAFRLFKLWARYITVSSGIKVKIICEDKFPDPPYVICPNHTSYLDIIIAYNAFPDYFVFMGKQELVKIPFFNVFFKRMHILVDRNSKSASHRSFLKAAEKIDQGACMIIFPEGTISKNAPRLSPFKNGPFKLAIDKQVPLIPVTYVSNYKILGNGSFWNASCGPGKSIVYIHKAIRTSNLDLTEIKEKVYTLLDGKISEHLYRQNPKAPSY